jgi:hypothetical protein
MLGMIQDSADDTSPYPCIPDRDPRADTIEALAYVRPLSDIDEPIEAEYHFLPSSANV